MFILIGNDLFPVLCGKANELLDTRNLTAHDRPVSERGSGPVVGQCFSFIQAAFDTVNTVTVMERIVTQFKPDIEQYQQRCRDTYGQTEDIDHRK